MEADENAAKVDELKGKVKTLEQDNLAKDNEIKSLTHKNGLLDSQVEKLDGDLKHHKGIADESTQAGTQAEILTRKVQVLEEEAEESDRNLRETNDK